MADAPKSEVSVDGCILWLILFAIIPIPGALYAIASAIKGLGHG